MRKLPVICFLLAFIAKFRYCVGLLEFDYRNIVTDDYTPTKKEFNGLLGSRLNCISEIQQEITEVFKDFLNDKRRIGYADPAVNANLGDQLLWAGTKFWLILPYM